MKKFIIATIVGGLIIYIWSVLAWLVLPAHTHTFSYAPKQDTILNTLHSSLPGPGAYMMPTADNRNVGMFDSKYRQAAEENRQKMMGKPYAMVFYGMSKEGMDPMQYLIGILLDLVAVAFAVTIFVMAKDKLNTFFQRWWLFIVIGLIVSCNTYLIEWNWMGFPWHYTATMLVDVIMEWGLCGAWVAWYFRKA